MAFIELTEQSQRIQGGKKVLLNAAHIIKVDSESGKPNVVKLLLIENIELFIIGDYDTVKADVARAAH
jgi:hypothetical protein